MGRLIDGLRLRSFKKSQTQNDSQNRTFEDRLSLIRERLKNLKVVEATQIPFDNLSQVFKRKKKSYFVPNKKRGGIVFGPTNSSFSFFKGIDKLLVVLAFVVLAGGIFLQLPPVKDALLLLQFFRNGRFLIIFQNNQELRPTGGFIGSLAEVETQNFKLKNFWVEPNIYQKDNQFLQTHFIPTPQPMREIWPNSFLALANANWSIDFEESAKNLLWYYGQEYGKGADGVVAINATLVANLLKLTGPINLPAFSQTLSAENFFQALTKEIQQDYWTDPRNEEINKPKLILAETAPLLLEAIKKISPLQLFQFARAGFGEKEIQLYFQNEKKQLKASGRNWAGRVSQQPSDYLMINNSNLGGGKSSQNIQENIYYRLQNQGGTLISNLTIIRSHKGSGQWPDAINKNYMRILVPKETELLGAKLNGQKIEKVATETESHKTSFGFWVETPPQKTNRVEIVYRLPSWLSPNCLIVQKQSGAPADLMEVFYNNQLIFRGNLTQDLEIPFAQK